MFKKHHFNRLLKLAQFLEQLPRNDNKRRFDYRMVRDVNPCGTKACAFGWAPNVRCIREAGLVHNHNGHVYCLDNKNPQDIFGPGTEDGGWLWDELFMPDTGTQFGFRSPPYTATAKQVAKHIRRWVRCMKKQQDKELKLAVKDNKRTAGQ